MKEIFDGRALGGISIVIVVVGVSAWAIAKAGRRLKSELGSRGGGIGNAELIPPTLVKKALERGLVTPAQLAKMTPTERKFLLASLKDSLDEGHGPRG